jgi:hypothetical protein
MPITNTKDDALKLRRLLKNKNSNKEKNKTVKYFKNNGSCQMFYSYEKAVQQYLNDEYNIKIHKNKLREGGVGLTKTNYYPDISFDDNFEYNYIDLDNDNTNNKKKFTGNIEISKLKYILSTYLNSEKSKIPIDWTYKHDKTRWSRTKIQDILRKKQRNYKENCLEE